MPDHANYLPSVRAQYEDYPYPPRNPEDERSRLVPTTPDKLPVINHYCYSGTQNYRDGYRALVAGGGTGDSAIFLAEQLRDTDATITYLDISRASMEVAVQRAKVRGLSNIEWHHGSLLDLPTMDLAPFDYINCTGVLHHLEDPSSGLEALKSVLKDDGSMGIMVYGTYGRTGIYQMQRLMRLINGDEPDPQKRIDETKGVLAGLPPQNWFKRAETPDDDHLTSGDVGIHDLLLHSQDRSYSVPELYQWVEDCGLELVAFNRQAIFYHPEFFIGEPAVLQRIMSKPLRERQAIAELIFGGHTMHSFYATRDTNSVATTDNRDNVPFLLGDVTAQQLYDAVKDAPIGSVCDVALPGITMGLTVGRFTAPIFKELDGRKSLRELIGAVLDRCDRGPEPAPRPNGREVLEEFKELFGTLNLLQMMFLRHKSVKFPEIR